MWLTTPDTIEDILLEQQFEPLIDVDQPVVRKKRGAELPPREEIRDLPIAVIGQPRTWALQGLYSPNELPAKSMTSNDDFYLVRFSCSFRPIDEEKWIKWARFRATLLPDELTNQRPTAFGLYPQEVYEEVPHKVKVTLSPSLKFQELVDANIGSVEFGFEYTELIPQITTSIGTSYDPSWDYRPGRGKKCKEQNGCIYLLALPRELKEDEYV